MAVFNIFIISANDFVFTLYVIAYIKYRTPTVIAILVNFIHFCNRLKLPHIIQSVKSHPKQPSETTKPKAINLGLLIFTVTIRRISSVREIITQFPEKVNSSR